MTRFSTPDEILDFAIAREIEANKFYGQLAERMADSPMGQVFRDFADDELGHRQKLEAIKAEHLIPKQEEVGSLDIADYIVAACTSPQMSYADTLVLAMRKEKKAFRLYHDLAARMHRPELRNVFLFLAQEEAGHKLRFEVEYDLTTF